MISKKRLTFHKSTNPCREHEKRGWFVTEESSEYVVFAEGFCLSEEDAVKICSTQNKLIDFVESSERKIDGGT